MMVERVAVGGWLVVLGTAFVVGMALLVPSLNDIRRYLRMRRM